MSNYKAYVDELITCLNEITQSYTINKTKEFPPTYKLVFGGNDFFSESKPSQDEIRNFADSIQFGLQGKSEFPNIVIENISEDLSSAKLLLSIFKNVDEKSKQEKLLNVFYKEISPIKLLTTLLNALTPEEPTGKAINYLLKKEALDIEENKNINNFNNIIKMLIDAYIYRFEYYKEGFREFINSYEPIINHFNNTEIDNKNIKEIRNNVSLFLRSREHPKNYYKYKKLLPLADNLDMPVPAMFSETTFQIVNFEMSYLPLLQNDLIVTDKKDIEINLSQVVRVMNNYLKDNKFLGLMEIGQINNDSEEEYKTTIWFKINTETTNINDTVIKSKMLLGNTIEQHKEIVVNFPTDVDIGSELKKCMSILALDIIVPNKFESNNNKMKI